MATSTVGHTDARSQSAPSKKNDGSEPLRTAQASQLFEAFQWTVSKSPSAVVANTARQILGGAVVLAQVLQQDALADDSGCLHLFSVADTGDLQGMLVGCLSLLRDEFDRECVRIDVAERRTGRE